MFYVVSALSMFGFSSVCVVFVVFPTCCRSVEDLQVVGERFLFVSDCLLSSDCCTFCTMFRLFKLFFDFPTCSR